MKKETKWVHLINGEVRGIFKNRKEAIKYFKELLVYTLKNFKKQDKTDEFDYPIKISEIEFKPIDERESYLSLLN